MTSYTEQGTIDLNAGDYGGDLQATNAVSRRFVQSLDDGGFAVIDVIAYGTSEVLNDDEENPNLDVQEMITYTLCTDAEDPGSTEIYSDIEYDWPFFMAPHDLDIAYDWAKNYVADFDPEHLSWEPK